MKVPETVPEKRLLCSVSDENDGASGDKLTTITSVDDSMFHCNVNNSDIDSDSHGETEKKRRDNISEETKADISRRLTRSMTSGDKSDSRANGGRETPCVPELDIHGATCVCNHELRKHPEFEEFFREHELSTLSRLPHEVFCRCTCCHDPFW